ncbi:MAG: 3-deoxy-manno-octulosonate cytidylyltransferase [Oligoflexales bacterium]|nr:3-deoxy-manno-octulosonate cytidylyltransferase [Oligoflexales bacterium]
MLQWLIVIPARLQSSRLAKKMLQNARGKPLILKTYEHVLALRSKTIQVLIATDADEIFSVCRSAGAECVMTSAKHQSGSDRVFEAASLYEAPFILNLQGDEPEVSLEDVKSLMQNFAAQSDAAIGTLVFKNLDETAFQDPNIVKAVLNQKSQALYFSRAAIPFRRLDDSENRTKEFFFWQHIGVYAYRRESLKSFCQAGPSELEGLEKLEQLRALQMGMTIYAQQANKISYGIDTQQDLDAYNAKK